MEKGEPVTLLCTATRVKVERTSLCNTLTRMQVVYMGKDKYENEELLKYGFPEAGDSISRVCVTCQSSMVFRRWCSESSARKDIWFHVDKLSSAHVCRPHHAG